MITKRFLSGLAFLFLPIGLIAMDRDTTNLASPMSPEEEQAFLARFNEKWQRGEVDIDEDVYRRNILARAEAALAEKEGLDDQEKTSHCSASEMPQWLVGSSLKRMPTLLQGIFNYLKLYGKEGRVPSYHRFIIVGKPGVGKTTLAYSIAQALEYEIVFIHASELFGRYRNHTAINLRELFDGVKRSSACKVVIIDELHKLFENHAYKRTDDAANATAFWNQLDELEKRYPNVVVIGTANSVENMPAEIKSRFHGKIITMSLPDKGQQGHVLQEILAHDTSIQRALSVDEIFLNKLVSRFNRYSLRDIQLLVDAAKMFKYAELSPAQSP